MYILIYFPLSSFFFKIFIISIKLNFSDTYSLSFPQCLYMNKKYQNCQKCRIWNRSQTVRFHFSTEENRSFSISMFSVSDKNSSVIVENRSLQTGKRSFPQTEPFIPKPFSVRSLFHWRSSTHQSVRQTFKVVTIYAKSSVEKGANHLECFT